jgi:hypothetical protein
MRRPRPTGAAAAIAGEFPLLASLVERHGDEQRALPVGGQGRGRLAPGTERILTGVPDSPLAPDLPASRARGPVAAEAPGSPAATGHIPSEPDVAGQLGIGAPGAGGDHAGRRVGRYGLSIQFAARPGDTELGRLIDATVWVNEAHPAYRRAAASRSEGYHVALAVALALGPLAVEPAREHAFVTAFLASWGEALGRRGRRGQRRAIG